MKDRKSFQHLSGEENPQFGNDGYEIYLSLKEKYPEKSVVDLDNILNALCASLIILTMNNVEKSNHQAFLQLIYQILSKNLK